MISTFKDKYYAEFEEEEENKLSYMEVYQEYRTTVESFIMKNITEKKRFSKEMIQELERMVTSGSKDGNVSLLQDQGEVVELIFSLTDFLVFKDLMLDHKYSRMGRYNDFNMLQVVSFDKK